MTTVPSLGSSHNTATPELTVTLTHTTSRSIESTIEYNK